jgi:hypothetical protein
MVRAEISDSVRHDSAGIPKDRSCERRVVTRELAGAGGADRRRAAKPRSARRELLVYLKIDLVNCAVVTLRVSPNEGGSRDRRPGAYVRPDCETRSDLPARAS